MKYKY